ncbi:MAG: hypothetical protein RLZZ450_88 [Pseudomonadota bacterium]|jgi:hypothetical protein
MSFGPKSKQRKARIARSIKHFAQSKLGLKGRSDLVEFLTAAATSAAVSLALEGSSGGGATLVALGSVERALAKRGVSKTTREVVLSEVRAGLRSEALRSAQFESNVPVIADG